MGNDFVVMLMFTAVAASLDVHTRQSHPPWLQFDEAPCTGEEILDGNARAAWSCIRPLPGGPTRRPSDNPLYSKDQLFQFDTQPIMMPQAGPARSGGLLRQALPSELLDELLGDVKRRGGTFGCKWLDDEEQTDFNQFNQALGEGRAPCRINMTGSVSFGESIQIIHSELELWAGAYLSHANANVVFSESVLLYPEGSVVQAHCDRPDTHHVSATLVLASEGLADGWPLEVALWDKAADLYHDAVAVYTQPGDLVAYQGARWEHARPYPLRGSGSMVIVLIAHFSVVNWRFYVPTDEGIEGPHSESTKGNSCEVDDFRGAAQEENTVL